MSALGTGARSAEQVAKLLHDALVAGDFTALGDLYADDALLDASLVGRRSRIAGPERPTEFLASQFPGHGRLVEWSPQTYPAGIALWFERICDDGTAVRQRHYLRLRNGSIERHWAYTAPPRTSASGAQDGGGVLLDTRLVSQLGEVAEHEPLVSTGWSGNLLERIVLADGHRLVAKRIVPGTNWIDRHTKDEGREALLFTSGVLGRMPHAIDHAVVAAERDGDAWWVVMRDVSDPAARRQATDQGGAPAHAGGREPDVGGVLGEQVPHLCTLHDCFGLFSPAIAEAERDGLDLLPKQYEAFWEAFAEAVDSDVAEAVLALLRTRRRWWRSSRPAARPSFTPTSAMSRSASMATASSCSTGAAPARATPWSTSSGRSATTPGGSTPLTTSWSRTSGARGASATTRAPSTSE